MQPTGAELWNSRDPLAQIALERLEQGHPGLARTIHRQFQPTRDASPYRLAVEPDLAGNSRDAGALTM
jgi:hypothetical protein